MDKMIANHWNILRKSAETSARQLAEGCCEETVDIMRRESDRFFNSAAPANRAELDVAYTRRMSLSARLTAIKRADAVAVAHPEQKGQILDEVSRFCDASLPEDNDAFLQLQEQNLELSQKIATLCLGS